jgi:SAM-dependent methyltransferase
VLRTRAVPVLDRLGVMDPIRNVVLDPLRDAETRRYIRWGYQILLQREPDAEGEAHFLEKLRSGEITRREFLERLRISEEFRFKVPLGNALGSLHLSRCEFVRSLPKASRIIDLGGTHLTSEYGAFVNLGYPYRFERLVIVDLPPEERHELYHQDEAFSAVESPLGPVEYRYASMTDLSPFKDGEFDLVYCGQAIEHVTEEDGTRVIEQAFRVLEPGGWFCLDTPNGYVCRMQQQGMINPDHDVEYTHAELSAKLEAAGFEIAEAWGLNYGGPGIEEGRFSMADMAANTGMFQDIENCYLLAYVCHKPSR